MNHRILMKITLFTEYRSMLWMLDGPSPDQVTTQDNANNMGIEYNNNNSGTNEGKY